MKSATDRLANSSGLVGRYLTVQPNQAVWGVSKREIRAYKGPPSLALTEHWNYEDRRNFFGGYWYLSQVRRRNSGPILWPLPAGCGARR
jgi:hypothetical protein